MHGGEAAVKAIQHGSPLTGLAQAEQGRVEADLAERGVTAMTEEAAIRLETAARLYWGAFVKAAESGDMAAIDRYAQRFGWLQGNAIRAWAQVTADQKDAAKRGAGIIDVLTAIRGKADGQANE